MNKDHSQLVDWETECRAAWDQMKHLSSDVSRYRNALEEIADVGAYIGHDDACCVIAKNALVLDKPAPGETI